MLSHLNRWTQIFQVDVVQLLVDRGAALSAVDNHGFTALDWALALYLHHRPVEGVGATPDTVRVQARARNVVRILTMAGPADNAQGTTGAALSGFQVDGLLDIPSLRGGAGARFDTLPQPPPGSVSSGRCDLMGACILVYPSVEVMLWVVMAGTDKRRNSKDADGRKPTFGDEGFPGVTALGSTVAPPAPEVCQQCAKYKAKVRCSHCSQVQCERCAVELHEQESRRHHQVNVFAAASLCLHC